jgi:hypothetical protein
MPPEQAGSLFARAVGTNKQRRNLPRTLYRQIATPKNYEVCRVPKVRAKLQRHLQSK